MYLIEQLVVGHLGHGLCDRAVVDDGGLVAPADLHVTVHTVMARIEVAAREPGRERLTEL